MRYIQLLILFNCLIAQSKYPADSLLSSEKTPTIYKLGLLPIAGWQRISYNTNFFNCQFYPSCSNYGAHAIGKYGIIRGGVIASDRIIRCNPFAIYYHIDINRPFNESDGRLIDPVVQRALSTSTRSPLFAALLSSFIPGAGRAYSGRLFDGIMGLWTFYLTGSSAYLAIKDERPFAGPFLGIIATYVYLGEIYGAWRAAKYYQKPRK